MDNTLEESRARLPVAAKELPAKPTADAFHEDAKPGDRFLWEIGEWSYVDRSSSEAGYTVWSVSKNAKMLMARPSN